jgi:hypothetical protein
MNVTIVEGNLLDQNVDVIVNAWNRNIMPWWLLLPQGVSGGIKKRGGTRKRPNWIHILRPPNWIQFQPKEKAVNPCGLRLYEYARRDSNP